MPGVPHLTVVNGGLVDDNGAPIPYSEAFYGQHAPQQLGNGNILLFDNGILFGQLEHFFPDPFAFARPWSRALELELDFVNNEARVVWQYTHNCGDPSNAYGWAFAPVVSNAIRLDNEHTLINFGSAGNIIAGMQGAPQTHRIVEVGSPDENNESHPVAEIVLTATGALVNYRVKPIASLYGEYYTQPSPGGKGGKKGPKGGGK